MITIRFRGNAKSLRPTFEVLRDGKVVGGVLVPGVTMRDLSAGHMAMEIALRDFR